MFRIYCFLFLISWCSAHGQISPLDSALIEMELTGPHLEKLLRAGLDPGDAHIAVAQYWINQNNAREAYQQLQKASPTDSTWAYVAEIVKSEIFMRTFRYDSAVKQLGRLLKRFPNDTRVMNSLAFALIRIGRIPEALQFLSKARASLVDNHSYTPCDSVTLEANILLAEAIKGGKEKWSEEKVRYLYEGAIRKGCPEATRVYLYFVGSYLFDETELVSSSLAEGFTKALMVRDGHLAALLLDRFITQGTKEHQAGLRAKLVGMNFSGVPELEAIVAQFMFITSFQEGNVEMAKGYIERYKKFQAESEKMYRQAGILFSEAQVALMSKQVEAAIANGQTPSKSTNAWWWVAVTIFVGITVYSYMKFKK